jgi:RNA polymerase sigma-70 factor (ECF subfamily)
VKIVKMHVMAFAEAPLAEDAELVRRIAAGQREAEEELCHRLGRRVRLYGLRHLRDQAAAADLTQQVLLITLEALRDGRLREPEKLVSFVLGTCRRVVLEIRRGGARRERLLELFRGDVPVASAFPSPGAEFQEVDLKQLAACLQGLGERERSVIVMTFYDERSGEEVAGFLGISSANVRVMRHRALARLRNCMEGGRAA